MKRILQLLVLGLSAFSLNAAEPTKKPNIVFILADDLSSWDLSCFGQTNFATPNSDYPMYPPKKKAKK